MVVSEKYLFKDVCSKGSCCIHHLKVFSPVSYVISSMYILTTTGRLNNLYVGFAYGIMNLRG